MRAVADPVVLATINVRLNAAPCGQPHQLGAAKVRALPGGERLQKTAGVNEGLRRGRPPGFMDVTALSIADGRFSRRRAKDSSPIKNSNAAASSAVRPRNNQHRYFGPSAQRRLPCDPQSGDDPRSENAARPHARAPSDRR